MSLDPPSSKEKEEPHNVEEKCSGVRASDGFLSIVDLHLEERISSKIDGKFFLIKYNHDCNREDQFCDFLIRNLINYALLKSELETTRDPSQYLEIVETACSRYVQNSDPARFRGGEIGEVILFHFLEVVENAVQVINKMSIKSASSMYYHGADAVHFGKKGDIKVLYFGESKTGFEFKPTLKAAIKSVNNFCDEEKEKEKFEVSLVAGHLSDYLPSSLRSEIIDYLDPLKDDLQDFTKAYAVFVGFEEKKLLDFEKDAFGPELIQKASGHYDDIIKKCVEDIILEIQKYRFLQNKRFYFYILPFKDLDTFRHKVLTKIKRHAGAQR